MNGEQNAMRRTRQQLPPQQQQQPYRSQYQPPPPLPAPSSRPAAASGSWKRALPPQTAARKVSAAAAMPTPRASIARDGAGTGGEGPGGGIGNLDFQQREELREIFDRIDVHARGYIPTTMLVDVMQAFGIERPAAATLAQWQAQADPEGTGRIGYARLEECVSLRYDEMSQREEILGAFRLFKPDAPDAESARITLDDLRSISVHLGEHIPDEELQEMINIADIDGSGSVGFADFMRIMRKSGLF
ncbi:centrin, EF-hand protein [Coemansia javaensis]|uniref:Centrin, EF-hand protein n=1 Tax=Coemansia javaensis TaxID=2761396 RepID=A0A9W8HJP3_9FUNG|nr:centrin, EF-hand protein [Coemansia javaensis]